MSAFPTEILKLPVTSWKYPKVVVYVPMMQALPYADEVFPAFIEIARQGTPFLHLPYGFADRMRNKAAEEFLKSDCTHLLMLDSDHVHPVDIVQRLCRWVADDPGKLVIGGMNFKRAAPYSPCAFITDSRGTFRLHEWEQGLMEVSSIGFGCVLIAREVFETVPRPWFYHDYSGAATDPEFGYPGHDLLFCHRAGALGVKIWCDTTTVSPHMTAVKVAEATYRTYFETLPSEQQEVVDNGLRY